MRQTPDKRCEITQTHEVHKKWVTNRDYSSNIDTALDELSTPCMKKVQNGLRCHYDCAGDPYLSRFGWVPHDLYLLHSICNNMYRVCVNANSAESCVDNRVIAKVKQIVHGHTKPVLSHQLCTVYKAYTVTTLCSFIHRRLVTLLGRVSLLLG